MSLSFCILGSGSSGNCTLLVLAQHEQPRYALIDAGLSPRETAKRLGPKGVSLGHISEILLTHTDFDHFHRGWAGLRQRVEITWRVHRRHVSQVLAAGLPAEVVAQFDDTFELGGGTLVEPTPLPHDQLGTTGFVIDHDGARLGYATDLGRAPAILMQRFVNLAALAIESNYDRSLQINSDRPAALKRRIMGGIGHLSNTQALKAVLKLAGQNTLHHIALLHLSRQCNDPRIVEGLYAQQAPHLLDRLTISNQRDPTPLLHVCRAGDRPQAQVAAGQQLSFLEGLPE